MTDEERQRQMDFILGQQAEFATNFRQAAERMTRIEEALERTDETLERAGKGLEAAQASVAQGEELVVRLAAVTAAGFKDAGEKINALIDAQIKTDEKMSALFEAQAHTDERLNALITTIERYIEGRQNGKS